jgi:hypothetical protein
VLLLRYIRVCTGKNDKGSGDYTKHRKDPLRGTVMGTGDPLVMGGHERHRVTAILGLGCRVYKWFNDTETQTLWTRMARIMEDRLSEIENTNVDIIVATFS